MPLLPASTLALAALLVGAAALPAQTPAAAPARAAAARAAAPVATPAPRAGQCAFARADNRLVGVVTAVEPEGRDLARRAAAGQRVVRLRLANGIGIGATYPRSVAVRDCAPAAARP